MESENVLSEDNATGQLLDGLEEIQTPAAEV